MGYALLAAAVVVLAALCAYLYVRERRTRESSEQVEALMAQVLEADERSRREIAENLHDQALQTLLAANQDLLEAAPGRSGVMRAHEIVAATIDEIRETVSALHPVTLHEGGLATALAAVARSAERQGGFECKLDIDPQVTGENDALLLAIGRELLTNAAKHRARRWCAFASPARGTRPSSRSPTTVGASRPGGARRRCARATSGWRRSPTGSRARGEASSSDADVGHAAPWSAFRFSRRG